MSDDGSKGANSRFFGLLIVLLCITAGALWLRAEFQAALNRPHKTQHYPEHCTLSEVPSKPCNGRCIEDEINSKMD